MLEAYSHTSISSVCTEDLWRLLRKTAGWQRWVQGECKKLHSRKEVRLRIQILNRLMSCRAVKTKLLRLSCSPDKSFAICLFSTCEHLIYRMCAWWVVKRKSDHSVFPESIRWPLGRQVELLEMLYFPCPTPPPPAPAYFQVLDIFFFFKQITVGFRS